MPRSLPIIPITASLIASLAALALPAVGVAQTDWAAERARQDAELANQRAQQEQQAEMARQSALAAQREADAAQARYDTEIRLRQLDQQRYSGANLIPPPATAAGRAALDARLRADAARLDALTDRLLADSNARIRAVKPASR